MLPHANSYNLPSPEMKRSGNPLVSICVYNYNYGRFLQQCLDSVAAQTYSNIEICFSDNASTDDSWKVALEFSQQYSGKMNLTRNRMNFGASSNLENCWLNTRGKYMLMLCTDDAMRPDFIERCVTLLEQNKDAAFAMVHRDIIDDDNNLTSELPFYNQTCLIPGYEQAAVYMMAAVNPSVSQILYNWERSQGSGKLGGFNYRWFGIRILDFSICCEYPIVYIHEPLLLNRVHSLSDGTVIDANLLQCMGQYVLLHQLAEIALVAGLEKAGGRLNGGLEKIGKLCLRYCVRFLLDDNEEVARRYLYLGQAILPNIVMDESFGLLQRYWDSGVTEGGKREILDILQNQANLATRLVSYDPPPGSIRC
jgi:glycosyltransferase involved in cell wall biosynthesis